jgi:hypothetical protein
MPVRLGTTKLAKNPKPPKKAAQEPKPRKTISKARKPDKKKKKRKKPGPKPKKKSVKKRGWEWEAQLAELAAYKAAHGDCKVPRDWFEDLRLAN